ncbi:MOSC domain-containing protein [Streptomyces sp. NPDC097619]|uniref:MOSC domain-containing protein n=1 Tax=Streptomyces sp. NPDC097619 TaxID=3157228 RepID=UPI003316F234
MHLISVNLGRATAVDYTDTEGGLTGIGKRPTEGPVKVFAPGPKGTAGSGVAGDDICDLRHHGGDHQAVYAYAREDLDWWEGELGRPLGGGLFGENLTTSGLDVNGALIGERWRIGPEVELEVAAARIPCRTFQGALGEGGWVKRFTTARRPGAYLRVVREGEIAAGDAVEVVHRPDHGISVELWFRAYTVERTLLPRLLEAGEALDPGAREKALRYAEGAGRSGSRAGGGS